MTPRTEPDCLIPLSNLQQIVGLSRSEIYRRCNRPLADGGLPRPVKVGRRSLWRMSDVQDWMAHLEPAVFAGSGKS